jgi:hypothetical protein
VDRVAASDRVLVVGTPRYRTKYDNGEPMGGFVVAAEADLIGKRMIGSEERKRSVLPILLDGAEETSFPPLLQGRIHGDFRNPERYFANIFELVLDLYGIAPRHPVANELRQMLLDVQH